MSRKLRSVALVVTVLSIGGVLPSSAWGQEPDPSPSPTPTETASPTPPPADPTPEPTPPPATPAPTPPPTPAPTTEPTEAPSPSAAPATSPDPSPESDEEPETRDGGAATGDARTRDVPEPCELVDCQAPGTSSADAIAALLAGECTPSGCPDDVLASVASALGVECGPEHLRSCTRLFDELTQALLAGCDASCAAAALDLAFSLADGAVLAACPAEAAGLCASDSFEATRSYAAMLTGIVGGAGAAAYATACASGLNPACAASYRAAMHDLVGTRLDAAYVAVCGYVGTGDCVEKQETLAQFLTWGYYFDSVAAVCETGAAGCSGAYASAVAGVVGDLADQAAAVVCGASTLAGCSAGSRASAFGVIAPAAALGPGDLVVRIQRGVAGTCGVTLETSSDSTLGVAGVSNPCVDQVIALANTVLTTACGSTDAVTCANELIETTNELLISVCSQSVVSSAAWASLTPPMWTAANVSHPCVDTTVAAANLVLRTACESADPATCANNLIRTINELLITACTVSNVGPDASPPTAAGIETVRVDHPCVERAFEAVNTVLTTVCDSTDAVRCAQNLIRTIDELLVRACTESIAANGSQGPRVVNGVELTVISHACVDTAFAVVNLVLTTACGSSDAATCADNLLDEVNRLLITVCTLSNVGYDSSPPEVNGIELLAVSHPCVERAFEAVNSVLTTVCDSTDAATCAQNLIRTIDDLLVSVCTQSVASDAAPLREVDGVELGVIDHECVDAAFAVVDLVLSTACGSTDPATCAENLLDAVQDLIVSACSHPVLDSGAGPVTVNGVEVTNVSHPCVEAAYDAAAAVLKTACRSADAATCADNLLRQINDLLVAACRTVPLDDAGEPVQIDAVALSHPCVDATFDAVGLVVSTVCGPQDAATCAQSLIDQIGDLISDACTAGPVPSSPLSGLTGDLGAGVSNPCVEKAFEVVNLVLSTICAEEEAAACTTGLLEDVSELIAASCGLSTGVDSPDPVGCAQAVLDMLMTLIPGACASVDVELALVDCPAPVSAALQDLIEAALEQVNATVVDFQVYPRRIDPGAGSGPRVVNVYAQVTLGAWRVEIRDSAGQPVQVYPGFTGLTTVTWDGRNALGNVVPAGAYEVVLLAPDDDAVPTESAWVFVGAGPTIGGLFPASVSIGDSVTIAGSGFTRGVGVFGVTIGDEEAPVLEWSDTSVKVLVPPSLDPGTYDLTLTAADAETTTPVTIKNHIPVRPSDKLMPGIIRVRVQPGASMGSAAAAVGDSVFEPSAPPGYPELEGWYDVTVPAGAEGSRVLAYAARPEVAFAGPIHLNTPHATPNDTLYGQQWYLQTRPDDTDIDAPEAWSIRRGSSDLTIAVLDTQVGTHEDLDVVSVDDYQGSCAHNVGSADHGTFVAGQAAARTNNGKGVAGVAWGARIREYRLGFTYQGSCYIGDWTDALLLAAQRDDVANMSFGGGPADPYVQKSVTAAWNRGLLIAASAGNDGSTTPQYPASYDNVVSVGALNERNGYASFTNRSRTVDVYAPGVAATSTARTDSGAANYESGWQGTSMASPLVAGALALLKAQAPTAPRGNLVAALKATTQGSPPRISISSALAKLYRISLPSGIFVKTSSSSPIWFLDDGGIKRRVGSRVLLSWGIPSASSSHVATVDASLLAVGYPTTGTALGFRPGTLLRQAGSATTYVVTTDGGWRRGQKRPMSAATVVCLHYDEARVVQVGKSELDLHPDGTAVGCQQHPNGTLIKSPVVGGGETLEVIVNGERRKFLTSQLAGSWGYTRDGVLPAPLDLTLPAGPNMGFRPGKILRNGGKLWVVTAAGSDFAKATIRQFSTATSINCYRLQGVSRLNATAAELALHTKGTTLGC